MIDIWEWTKIGAGLYLGYIWAKVAWLLTLDLFIWAVKKWRALGIIIQRKIFKKPL